MCGVEEGLVLEVDLVLDLLVAECVEGVGVIRVCVEGEGNCVNWNVDCDCKVLGEGRVKHCDFFVLVEGGVVFVGGDLECWVSSGACLNRGVGLEGGDVGILGGV